MMLLFRNALKGLKKKKVQMFAIIMLITLSTGIYTAMNTALDRLEREYYSYLDNQNVENISGDVVLNYNTDITLEDIEYLEENELKNISEEETIILNNYKKNIKANNTNIDSNLITNIEYIFTKYDASNYIETKKLESLQEKYNFDFEYEKSKTIMDDDKIMKVIPYNEDKKINVVYLKEGHLPETNLEITMLESFAKANNLKIGDNFKINDIEYKIVGFTYAPDYVYPLISFSTPIYDEAKNNIIYVYKDDYKDIVGIIDNTYSLRFKDNSTRKFKITLTEDENDESDSISTLFNQESSTITMGVNTISRIARIGALQLEFVTDRLFAHYFLYLLLAISIIIIIIVTKKRIEDERLQIGVLKSLGYSKYSIALSYLVYPILGSIIGGILGFTLGELLSGKVTSLFLSYYNVPLNNFTIDFKYLSECIMIPIIILSALSYLIALIMLRKKPLALLKEGSNLKVNLLSKFINFITKLLPFKQRFKYSLASRSFGKLLIVTITSFGVGMLITLTLIGANLFNNVIDLSFKGMKYDYIAYMNNYYTDKIENSDAILTTSLTLESIKDKDENLKNIDVLSDDDTISFTGIDNDAVTIELTNDDEDIKYMLEDNNVVVSKNMKEYLNLEIGDTLYFKYNDSILSYKIVGFSNELMSFNVYVNRSVLSENLGFSDSVYNVIYSNDTKYQSLSKLSDEELRKIVYVMSLKDLKANIEKQMDRFNASIYLVIAFAIVMAFVIIAVIANIIVEENKKTISLMKVMGYKNKEVSSIVLNIYTPIVIISYLLSIKAMISLLKWIVSKLIADMEITIPIALSFKDAMIGLIGLLMAYYVAIAISRKVLNKVPLAIALKRE